MAQTIELNGKMYDATSGLPVKDSPNKARSADRPQSSIGGFIDGFKRPAGQVVRAVKKTPVVQSAIKQLPTKSRAKGTPANKIHKRTRRAVTLLRRGVSKPDKKSDISVTPKVAVTKHHERAASINRSEKISRFSRPTAKMAEILSPKPTHKHPAPEKPVSAKTAVAKPTTNTNYVTPAKKTSEKEKLIAEGLAKAQAHREPKHEKPSKKRRWRIVLLILVVLIGVGYVVYLNIPNIAMKYAAARAGFSANLPSYNPAGFSLKGPIAYSQDQITVGYKSNTDAREYHITQKKSAWDSESLLTNYVTGKSDYQTYRDHGLTIYVYGTSNATWVNGGVWYTIEGESQLSAQQIVKIAASL